MSVTQRKLSIAALVVAAFLGGIFFVTSAANLVGLPSLFQRADAQVAAQDAAEGIATAEDLGQAFSAVAERVNPAVVQVRATQILASAGPDLGPFGAFFGQGPSGGEQQGLGSGAFVTSDGYIVTNNHVVENADELRVVLFDGRELDAEVVGTDPFSDLAVLKVDGDDFPSVPFGDSDELRVGQWVLAFGSPLSAELSNTVTSGIVSSLGRYSGGRDPMGRQSISNYIQTDAAVNPGNSGGPLVNLRGEIVGINSAIATRTGTYNGISFAIPSSIVRTTVEQLIDSGEVERGYLGISFQATPLSLRRVLDVGPGAATVAGFSEDADGDTPAEDAGLRVDDVITAVDGVTLRDANQIVSLISNKRPGDTVELTYHRGDRERTTTVTLGRRPGADQISQALAPGHPSRNGTHEPASEPASLETLGLTLQNLTPRLAREFEGSEGVLIANVDRTSEAYRDAEIQPGLLLTEVNRHPVASVADVQRALADIEDGGSFLVRVQAPTGQSYLTALTKEG